MRAVRPERSPTRWPLVFVVSCVVASPAFSDDGFPDGFCDEQRHEWDKSVWKVDVELNNRLNDALSLVNLQLDDWDTESFVDFLLQNMGRYSRARFQARVVRPAVSCDTSDAEATPCIEALSDAEDTFGCGSSDALAHAGCQVGIGCGVVVCQDHIAGSEWQTGTLLGILAHEFGHTYGMGHVDNAAGGTCDAINNPPLLCGTSDGCDGELMCSLALCNRSSLVTEGDSLGLRARYGSSAFSRRVFFGSDDIGALDHVAWIPSSPIRTSAFAPRIDCTDSTTSSNKCVAVVTPRTSSSASIQVVRLAGPSGGAWGVQSVVSTLSSTAPIAPDIAVDGTGAVAYVVRASVASQSQAFVTRVPLNGGAVTNKALAIVPAFAPRIVVAAGGVYVLSVAVDPSPGTGEAFTPPDWTLQRISADATVMNPVTFHPSAPGAVDLSDGIYMSGHGPISDFDFDCKSQTASTTTCTIVAQFLNDDADRRITRAQSIRFSLNSATPADAQLLDPAWDVGVNDVNGTFGVALTPTALFVAQSRPILSGTDTDNTRVTQISGDRLSGTVVGSVLHKCDAEPCETGSAYGYALPAASLNGGYSIAFCPGCTPNGSLEAVSWGNRSDGDDFCF